MTLLSLTPASRLSAAPWMQPLHLVRMSLPQEDSVWNVDVSTAAAEIMDSLLTEDEVLAEKLDAVYPTPYLQERDALMGQLRSSELLRRDSLEDMWPSNLDPDPEARSCVWVDELSCVGCTECMNVARSTFTMGYDYAGKRVARVTQQGEDDLDTIDEAVATCPADCIQWCSQSELQALEEDQEPFAT